MATQNDHNSPSKLSEIKSITVVERYEKGGLTAYSIDEGETFHPTVRQAFEHQAQVITAAKNSPDTTTKAEKNANNPS